MTRTRELGKSQLAQLNLLLPIDSPPTDLPEDRKRELSLALASLLLSAAGCEVQDDDES